MVYWREQERRFVFRCGYDKRHVPSGAGFQYDAEEQIWYTEDVNKLVDVKEYLTEGAKIQGRKMIIEQRRRAKESKATDSDMQIPAPEGLSYYGYQRGGIEFSYQRANVLLADDMGLGKTVQAIGVINVRTDYDRVLIICPASLRINWQKELAVWLTRDLPVYLLTREHSQQIRGRGIFIVNYDILSVSQPKKTKKNPKPKKKKNPMGWLKNVAWDLVVADECHMVKNAKAARSKAAYKIFRMSNHRILMTGTPILNRPIELYHLLQELGWKDSWKDFAVRYCEGKRGAYGWDVKGASNLEELNERLRSTVMIRRLKKDVLPDLPAKTRQILVLDGTRYQDKVRYERTLVEAFTKQRDKLERERDAAKESGNKQAYEAAVKRLKETRIKSIAEISRARLEVARAKLPDCVEAIKDIVESGPIIVFAHHREVIEQLEQKLRDHRPVIVQGGMTGAEKNKSVEDFQEGRANVFIGSLTAAGVGLTLTRASRVFFVEQDWRPGIMVQAEDRAHRIGQKDNVHSIIAVVDGSIDADMAKQLLEKQKIAEKALD